MTDLAALAASLAADPNITGKRDIDAACAMLGLGPDSAGRPGDDAAALPDGHGGWHLVATEGFINGFVETAPWFAGWCAVMVNLSDIAAMGGRPLAVTDAVWAPGADAAAEVFAGMRAASEAYGVPIVGGHTNLRTESHQLAASVLGHAGALITSFDAAPGDTLICAIDHRGRYEAPFDNWQCFRDAPPARLRDDLAILPQLAGEGLVGAGKDVSQGGIAGTALMLAECSGVAIEIAPEDIPIPQGVPLERWMTTFPSFGFLLSVRPDRVAEVLDRFQARDIVAAGIGRVTQGAALILVHGSARHPVWDHAASPYLGLARRLPAHA